MNWKPNNRELSAFQDCVHRLRNLNADEKGSVVILLFYYWVHMVLK